GAQTSFPMVSSPVTNSPGSQACAPPPAPAPVALLALAPPPAPPPPLLALAPPRAPCPDALELALALPPAPCAPVSASVPCAQAATTTAASGAIQTARTRA